MPPGFCLRAPLTRAAAVAVLVLSVAMLGAGSARAAKPRVSVLVFGGDGGPEASRHAARVLAKHGLQVVPASAVRAIGARAPGDAAEILRTAMSELHLTAVVMGKVTASHHKHTLQVVVRGADGATLAQTSISAASTRKLTRAVDATLWKKIGGAFRRKRSAAEEDPFASPTTEPLSATPPAPAPAPAPEPTPEPAPAPVVAEAAPEPATAPRPAVITRARAEEVPAEPPARAAQPTAFELALGPGAVYRQLSYLTDHGDALSEFRTKIPAPALAGNLTVFLHLGLPRLGATISAEQAAPTRAATTGNLEYRTFSGDYNGALLFGLPSRYVTVDVSIGGGRQRFALQPVGDA